MSNEALSLPVKDNYFRPPGKIAQLMTRCAVLTRGPDAYPQATQLLFQPGCTKMSSRCTGMRCSEPSTLLMSYSPSTTSYWRVELKDQAPGGQGIRQIHSPHKPSPATFHSTCKGRAYEMQCPAVMTQLRSMSVPPQVCANPLPLLYCREICGKEDGMAAGGHHTMRPFHPPAPKLFLPLRQHLTPSLKDLRW